MGCIVKVWDFTQFVQNGKPKIRFAKTYRLHTCWTVWADWRIPQDRSHWLIDESDARYANIGRSCSKNVQD
jgi:hypothetical protein